MITLETAGTLHVMHTAQSQLSLPIAGQSISREAITDFMSTTICRQWRHHIPSLQRNKADREPSHVWDRLHTGQGFIVEGWSGGRLDSDMAPGARPAPQVYRHRGINLLDGVYKPPPPLHFHSAIDINHCFVKN